MHALLGRAGRRSSRLTFIALSVMTMAPSTVVLATPDDPPPSTIESSVPDDPTTTSTTLAAESTTTTATSTLAPTTTAATTTSPPTTTAPTTTAAATTTSPPTTTAPTTTAASTSSPPTTIAPTTAPPSTDPGAASAAEVALMALAPADVPPTCSVSTPVRAGSRVGARCLETRLRELGYTGQTPDDYFNPTSVDALRAFQTDFSLNVSGIADRNTLNALLIWAQPAATCSVAVEVRLYSSAGARCVETRLRQLGFTGQSPDDYFNTTSVNALIQFQHNVGMATTGDGDDFVLHALGVWKPPPASCSISYPVRLGSVAGALCVETRLRQLGLTGQTPDNSFNSTSVTSLRAFQQGYGLAATGIADRTTLQRLGIYRVPPSPTCTVSVRVRRYSVAGAQCVEIRLAQLGLIGSAPDDYLNENSVQAIAQFQHGSGLSSNGVADSNTLRALGIWKSPPSPTCTVSYTVKLDSTTGARCVETRLVQLGLTGQTPDDRFNATSVQALRYFQHNLGLNADGIAGQSTLSALGIWKPPPNPYPVPANSGSGRRIVYSRAQQRIWAIDASGNVLKTHRVSGRTYEPYGGTYYVYSRSLYTYSANDPSVRWRYMVRFAYGFNGGRIGFHEIPNRNGVPLQSAEQLGLPLSGGCVRQSTPDALWVWNWAYIGTKVVVL